MTSSVWKSKQPGSSESGAQTRISLVLYRVGKIPTWHWQFLNNPRHFHGSSESRYLSYCLSFTEESRWITHQTCRVKACTWSLTGILPWMPWMPLDVRWVLLKKCLLQNKSFRSFPWEKPCIGFPSDAVVVCDVRIRTGAASSFCFTWMSDPRGFLFTAQARSDGIKWPCLNQRYWCVCYNAHSKNGSQKSVWKTLIILPYRHIYNSGYMPLECKTTASLLSRSRQC